MMPFCSLEERTMGGKVTRIGDKQCEVASSLFVEMEPYTRSLSLFFATLAKAKLLCLNLTLEMARSR